MIRFEIKRDIKRYKKMIDVMYEAEKQGTKIVGGAYLVERFNEVYLTHGIFQRFQLNKFVSRWLPTSMVYLPVPFQLMYFLAELAEKVPVVQLDTKATASEIKKKVKQVTEQAFKTHLAGVDKREPRNEEEEAMLDAVRKEIRRQMSESSQLFEPLDGLDKQMFSTLVKNNHLHLFTKRIASSTYYYFGFIMHDSVLITMVEVVNDNIMDIKQVPIASGFLEKFKVEEQEKEEIK